MVKGFFCNVHGLLHFADDVKTFDPLDNVSCFIFENFLGYFENRCDINQTNPLYKYCVILKKNVLEITLVAKHH